VTEFLQLCFAGLALGARYALVALGFVITYRATGALNLALVALLALGGYLAYAFIGLGVLPFAVAVALAIACTSGVGVAAERVVLRRMVGRPVFAVIMITVGLLYVLEQAITVIWGFDTLELGDPWGVDTVRAGGVVLAVRDLWTLALVALALVAFFAFQRFSRMGVAMRAAASDQEAALANGISVRRVFAVSWGISAALAGLAGITLAAGPASLSPGIGYIALAAFPAMIVGGLDSPGGAVAGGLLVGLVQALTAGYQDELFSWAGQNVSAIMPYVVMIAILLVRPYGLFGTREVRRA
jgi:branched-chain amino acid transport system permease protein